MAVNETPEGLIDAGEVARRLSLDRETVLAMAQDGRLPSLRLGRKVIRFEWQAVLAVMRGEVAK